MVFWVTSLPSFQWIGQPSHLMKIKIVSTNNQLPPELILLVYLRPIVLQGRVRVVVRTENVGFSEDRVAEELVLLEEEAEGEPSVVRAVE